MVEKMADPTSIVKSRPPCLARQWLCASAPRALGVFR
jgi:hypothetical protein